MISYPDTLREINHIKISFDNFAAVEEVLICVFG